MNASGDELVPDVCVILEAAREQSGGGTCVSIDMQLFPEAVAEAETTGRVLIIAEVEPTNPTTGGIREDDPVELAHEMVADGAMAPSALTEPEHSGDSAESLRRVCEAIDMPVPRRGFIMNEARLDVVQSDLALLITRFVDEDLPVPVGVARNRGLQPFMEAHAREELTATLVAGTDIVGINNCGLEKLEVDLGTFEEFAPEVSEDVPLVAESGMQTVDDVRRVHEADADTLFVGTAIIDDGVRRNTETLIQ